eukprot:TRINITY_DN9655_c0_g1_i1.p1 TRINITY_DN9655_c0_g1~~TRINITY_DN9655_c0_g1_i1.p1  ORF type:complete len:909 (+),score=100.98 TRINITY_DN9655_c0_g1_i1:34-2727(+)
MTMTAKEAGRRGRSGPPPPIATTLAAAVGTTGRQNDPFYDHELPGAGIAIASLDLDDQVEKFVEQEQLSDVEKLLYLLHNGSNAQRIGAIESAKLLPWAENIERFDGAQSEGALVLHQIGESVWQLDPEVQTACADSIHDLLRVLQPCHVELLLPLLLTMTSLHNEDIRAKWYPVLLEALRHLRTEVLEGEVLQLALRKGDLSETPESRGLSCEMLGLLAHRLPGPVVERGFLREAMTLCQDTDYTVRIRISRQLQSVARAVGPAKAKTVVMRELLELLKDEEPEVQRTAFTSLVEILDLFDDAYRRGVLLPLIRNYVANPPDTLHDLLLRLFGKILWSLASDVHQRDEDLLVFCNFFKLCAQRAAPPPGGLLLLHRSAASPLACHPGSHSFSQASPAQSYRELCAYNLPAVAKAVGEKHYGVYLHSTLRSLVEDTNVAVRRIVAAGFHEVCSSAGERAASLLREPFLQLARDGNLEVQSALFANLASSIRFFDNMQSEQVSNGLFGLVLLPLVQYEQQIRTNWRRTVTLLDQLLFLSDLLPPEAVSERILPLLLRHLSTGTAPVKEKCAVLAVHCLRRLSLLQQVEQLARLVQDFARSPSYWDRLAFLHVCDHVAENFSRRYARERLLDAALDLARDPVATVRRRLCSLLPHLHRVVWPSDTTSSTQLAVFHEKARALLGDSDREVVSAAEDAVRRVEETEQTGGAFARASTQLMRDDEEQALIEAAQEYDRQMRRKQIREMMLAQQGDCQQPQQEKPGAGLGNTSSASGPSGSVTLNSTTAPKGPTGKRKSSVGSTTNAPIERPRINSASKGTGGSKATGGNAPGGPMARKPLHTTTEGTKLPPAGEKPPHSGPPPPSPLNGRLQRKDNGNDVGGSSSQLPSLPSNTRPAHTKRR